MAVSFTHRHLALFSDSGTVWMGTASLKVSPPALRDLWGVPLGFLGGQITPPSWQNPGAPCWCFPCLPNPFWEEMQEYFFPSCLEPWFLPELDLEGPMGLCGGRAPTPHIPTAPGVSLSPLLSHRKSSASSTPASDPRPSRWFGEQTKPWQCHPQPLLGSPQLCGTLRCPCCRFGDPRGWV